MEDETEVRGGDAGQVLDELRQAEEREQDEGNGGEQRIEGEAARQEGDVAFVGCLQDASEKPER